MLGIDKYIYLLFIAFFVMYSLDTFRIRREKSTNKKNLRAQLKNIENLGISFNYDNVIILLPIIVAVATYLLFTDLELPNRDEVMMMTYMSGVFLLLGLRNRYTLLSSSWAIFIGVSTLPLYIYINQKYYVLFLLVTVLSIGAYCSCYLIQSRRKSKEQRE